jgi:hypothetical protein
LCCDVLTQASAIIRRSLPATCGQYSTAPAKFEKKGEKY